MWCSWQGPRLLMGKRTSGWRGAKCRAVGLAGCITLVIKGAVFGKSGNPPFRSRIRRFAAANHTPARAAAGLRRPARAQGWGPGSAERSICRERACIPPAPDLQSVTLSAERRPRKRAPPAPPIQSVNAKWSKLTRRQSPRLQVGEAPYSLHSRASMQPRGAPFRRACMQKSRPLDHRNYPIDIARGPRGGREPIKRVSNEALRALCARRAPLARRRSGRRQAVPFRRIHCP